MSATTAAGLLAAVGVFDIAGTIASGWLTDKFDPRKLLVATIVFGWVFASHQIGAATAAFGAGVIRDVFGTYTYAWWGGAALCLIAASLSTLVQETRRVARGTGTAPVAQATTERTQL